MARGNFFVPRIRASMIQSNNTISFHFKTKGLN